MKDHKKLYNKIPILQCKDGCHDCCGPVPFTKTEWDQVEDKREAKSLHCPYISESGCAIYDQRPFMCRIFGASKELRCPHGCRPIKLLSKQQTHKLMNKYQKLFKETTNGIAKTDTK